MLMKRHYYLSYFGPKYRGLEKYNFFLYSFHFRYKKHYESDDRCQTYHSAQTHQGVQPELAY